MLKVNQLPVKLNYLGVKRQGLAKWKKWVLVNRSEFKSEGSHILKFWWFPTALENNKNSKPVHEIDSLPRIGRVVCPKPSVPLDLHILSYLGVNYNQVFNFNFENITNLRKLEIDTKDVKFINLNERVNVKVNPNLRFVTSNLHLLWLIFFSLIPYFYTSSIT